MKGVLPDVNVLLALAWPNHQFHQKARRWYQSIKTVKWYTCSITQLGFIRLSANPAYTPYAKTPLEATLLFNQLIKQPNHCFLEQSSGVSNNAFQKIMQKIRGHKQVTDAYLIALSSTKKITFVTFDQKVQHFATDISLIKILSAGED
jgi:toxin-antitoxin system PIN domain toxin